MGSKISITFTEEAVIDDYVSFNRRLISSPAVDFNMIEVFKAVRNNIGEVLVANPISSGGGSSAINFAQAFELDFNWGGFNGNCTGSTDTSTGSGQYVYPQCLQLDGHRPGP